MIVSPAPLHGNVERSFLDGFISWLFCTPLATQKTGLEDINGNFLEADFLGLKAAFSESFYTGRLLGTNLAVVPASYSSFSRTRWSHLYQKP
jgi:hypothetical protein